MREDKPFYLWLIKRALDAARKANSIEEDIVRLESTEAKLGVIFWYVDRNFYQYQLTYHTDQKPSPVKDATAKQMEGALSKYMQITRQCKGEFSIVYPSGYERVWQLLDNNRCEEVKDG